MDTTATQIRVSRTLVKSAPELAELVAAEPRLNAEGIEVTIAEKGMGTQVAIAAAPDCGVAEDELEGLLAALAAPQKRPFTAS